MGKLIRYHQIQLYQELMQQQELQRKTQIDLRPYQHSHQRCHQHCQQWLPDCEDHLLGYLVQLFRQGQLRHLQLW